MYIIGSIEIAVTEIVEEHFVEELVVAEEPKNGQNSESDVISAPASIGRYI